MSLVSFSVVSLIAELVPSVANSSHSVCVSPYCATVCKYNATPICAEATSSVAARVADCPALVSLPLLFLPATTLPPSLVLLSESVSSDVNEAT